MLNTATKNIADILSIAMQHSPEQTAVIVADKQCPLAVTLTDAYRTCLPNAKFLNFDEVTPAEILATFAKLKPLDLVILIQSTSFRLEAYRIRIELFNRSLKVIEHPHLSRMPGEEADYYIESLAYDPTYYRGVGKALKHLIDNASTATIDSGGEKLIYSAPLEEAKLNIGDYTDMKNIGGQYPIGEVFTEARDLESVNGRVRIFVFGDTSFTVNKPEHPITLVIEKGRVIDAINSTAEFDVVLANIRKDEGEVWLRELGFGMNRAFSATRTVRDIGTYERMCGVHLSLGAKHGAYKKDNIRRADARHHVDVFAVTEKVYLDDKVVYKDGQWSI
jgi:aminopeptidase